LYIIFFNDSDNKKEDLEKRERESMMADAVQDKDRIMDEFVCVHMTLIL